MWKSKKNQTKPKARTLRQRAFRRGRWAEFYASWVLRAKGYHVLARNFAHPLGEIDLIARRGRLLVFVEVKYRQDWMSTFHAVTPAQWRRISAGATGFVTRYPTCRALAWRFDLFVVGGYGRCAHKKNFWCP